MVLTMRLLDVVLSLYDKINVNNVKKKNNLRKTSTWELYGVTKSGYKTTTST
jgi:hypothetical protein